MKLGKKGMDVMWTIIIFGIIALVILFVVLYFFTNIFGEGTGFLANILHTTKPPEIPQ